MNGWAILEDPSQDSAATPSEPEISLPSNTAPKDWIPSHRTSRSSRTEFARLSKIPLVIPKKFCHTNANLHPTRPCSRSFPHPARHNPSHRRVPAG